MSDPQPTADLLEQMRAVMRDELEAARRREAAPALLSMDEAADAIGVSRRTLDTLQAEGEIATLKIGRRRLVPADALRAFVNARAEQ